MDRRPKEATDPTEIKSVGRIDTASATAAVADGDPRSPLSRRSSMKTLDAKQLRGAKKTMKIHRTASAMDFRGVIKTDDSSGDGGGGGGAIIEEGPIASGEAFVLSEEERHRAEIERFARAKRAAVEELSELRLVDGVAITALITEAKLQHRRCLSLAAAEELSAKKKSEAKQSKKRSEKDRSESSALDTPKPEDMVPPVLHWVHAEVFRTIMLKYLEQGSGASELLDGGGGQISVMLSDTRGSLLGEASNRARRRPSTPPYEKNEWPI